MKGEGIANILEQLAQAVGYFGAGMSAITLDYQEPSDQVAEGDLIPVITISLRPATLPTSQHIPLTDAPAPAETPAA